MANQNSKRILYFVVLAVNSLLLLYAIILARSADDHSQAIGSCLVVASIAVQDFQSSSTVDREFKMRGFERVDKGIIPKDFMSIVYSRKVEQGFQLYPRVLVCQIIFKNDRAVSFSISE